MKHKLKCLAALTCVALTTAEIALAAIAPVVAGDSTQVNEPTQEPIAYIGHGGFFDQTGRQIPVSQSFVEQAQSWYRGELLASLDAPHQLEFMALEEQLKAFVPSSGQARLVANQRSLAWLLANSEEHKSNDRLVGKLRALDFALYWEVPKQADLQIVAKRELFKLDETLAKNLALVIKADLPKFVAAATTGGAKTATTNAGTAYINECIAASVPIPPSLGVMDPAGTAGWKSQGFIPTAQQFIVGTPAEVLTYKSTAPAGMCYALPRYTSASLATVALDGIICISSVTSKVCIWDNQMSGTTFSFPAGTQIPIGVPNLAVDPVGRYQAGGFELLGGDGGVCTDCHAGENPYITHPDANLGGGLIWGTISDPPQSLPTFAPNRYDPLVPAAWPQNNLSQAGATVPAACSGCHVKYSAGRFPHLSNQLPGYCGTILPSAYVGTKATMPPSSPGSQSVAAAAFKNAYCNAAPDASVADAGDPHLKTTNGVHYDFQAAGEFTALRNSDTGFELQTRQSPVLTNFTPPANPYTGLASCVSLNTAAAIRAGRHRVTYQQNVGTGSTVQLRLDGKLIAIPASPINLGGGNVLRANPGGAGIQVQIDDGTIVTVTPRFWSSQNYWYLDVDVQKTPAREGTLGPVLAGDWLPRSPTGASFGPKPVPLANRHVVLNQTFANAWRVTATNSLFDYAAGTSTATFTDVNWPSPPGMACRISPLPSVPPLQIMYPDLAKQACTGITDEAKLQNCIFDVTVMGDRSAAEGYIR